MESAFHITSTVLAQGNLQTTIIKFTFLENSFSGAEFLLTCLREFEESGSFKNDNNLKFVTNFVIKRNVLEKKNCILLL